VRRLLILAVVAAVLALGGGSAIPGLDGRGGSAEPRDGRVVRVVDGDTLEVRVDGEEERVRLLGIDTPESVRPGAPVECAAKAAARALRRRALDGAGRGRRVRLRNDPTQDERDRFGRLLAYVELRDGTDLGRAQVRAGWGEPFVFEDRPFRRAGEYRRAARRARAGGLGVWGGCGGDFHRGH
jgi:micrococcal nuclease